jgi:hypothetical protein
MEGKPVEKFMYLQKVVRRACLPLPRFKQILRAEHLDQQDTWTDISQGL